MEHKLIVMVRTYVGNDGKCMNEKLNELIRKCPFARFSYAIESFGKKQTGCSFISALQTILY